MTIFFPSSCPVSRLPYYEPVIEDPSRRAELHDSLLRATEKDSGSACHYHFFVGQSWLLVTRRGYDFVLAGASRHEIPQSCWATLANAALAQADRAEVLEGDLYCLRARREMN